MANRLRRLANDTLPFAALLALAIGPAAAAAEARYEFRAWVERADAAAKFVNLQSPSKPADTKKSKNSAPSERTVSSFFAPASAKPSDSQSKTGYPFIASGQPGLLGSKPFVPTLEQPGLSAPPALHRPVHWANAPPLA